MAKAHQAPASHYRRALFITAHAIERFRERVEEEFKARPDADLGNLLDERVRISRDRVEVVDNIAGGVTSTLVKIESRTGELAYAVVRDNSVISVLTDSMTQNNFTTGAWERPMNNPFKSALKNVSPVDPSKVAPRPAARIEPEIEAPRSGVDEIALALGRAMVALERTRRELPRLEAEVERLRGELAQRASALAEER